MPGKAFVSSNLNVNYLEHFNDVAVLRLGVTEGTYVVFARVAIENWDSLPQNASARVIWEERGQVSEIDKVDVRIPGASDNDNPRYSLSLQGTLIVEPGHPKAVSMHCSSYRGRAYQSSLFAIEVTPPLRFD